jgi:hypothetical protein
MNEMDHFQVCVLCISDVTADVDHLHIKKIYLVNFSYIVVEDNLRPRILVSTALLQGTRDNYFFMIS